MTNNDNIMTAENGAESSVPDLTAPVVLIYTVLYISYLWFFIDFENETMHWLTLVLIPFCLLWLMLRTTGKGRNFKDAMRAVGFTRAGLGRGILWGLVCGLILGVVQAGMSRQGDKIWEVVKSGQVLYKLPIAFLLMIITAGFTEEFFFRGVLQGALARAFRRQWLAVVIASLLFGIYHLPYAYLLETWPSHGNIGAAFGEGVLFSAIMGLILGAIYAKTKHLIVPIICHAMFNAVWVMAVMKFGNGIKI